jgi:hypothetical protein
LEIGNWKLEIGNWKLEIGKTCPTTGGWKLEKEIGNGKWKMEKLVQPLTDV